MNAVPMCVQDTDDEGSGLRLWRTRRDLLEEFDSYVTDELRLSPRTAQFYREGLRALEVMLGKPPVEITAADLRAVKRATHLKPGTIAARINAAKAFHRWGAVEGYWKLNGIDKVRVPKQDSEEIPPISPGVARYVLETVEEPRVTKIAYLQLLQGCRVSGASRMDRSHLRGGCFHFYEKGKTRSVPLHPLVSERLDELLAESFDPKAGGRAWQRFRDEHDIRDVAGEPASTHSLRKCFGETIYDEGKHRWEVCQKILGHSLGVTERYIHITTGQMREPVEALDYTRYISRPTQLELAF